MSEDKASIETPLNREQSVAVKLLLAVLPYIMSAAIGSVGGMLTARSELNLLQYQVTEVRKQVESQIKEENITAERVTRLEQIMSTQNDTLKRMNEIAAKQSDAYDRIARDFDLRFRVIELQLKRLETLMESMPTRKNE